MHRPECSAFTWYRLILFLREPASASPTGNDSRQPTMPYNDFSANGNNPLNFVSQPKGALHFGPSPVEPEEIVRLLREKVTEDTVRQYLKSLDPSYNGDPSEKDKGWKEVIFRTLEEGLVVKYGGQEVYTRPERKEKEFLLDFVWLNQDETNAYRSA